MSGHSTSSHRFSVVSTQLTSDSLDSADKHKEADTEAPFDPLFASPSLQAVRRLLVVDGCNIARSSCGPTRNNVNCAGLMAVIRWLLVRKFEVVAFLPIIYNNNENFNATNIYLLQKLEELGVVTFTPARTARGDRRAFINYDDLYVASLAARHGGTVLSGDRFKDILAQAQYNGLHEVLRNRCLDVRFHILKHPYAQIGEDRFIDRIPELCLRPADRLNDAISKRLWAERNDPDYQKVLLRRRSWSKQQSDRMVATIDLLMDELCEKMAIRPIQLSPPYTQWIAQEGTRNRREVPGLRQASTHAHRDLVPANEYQAAGDNGDVETQQRRTMTNIQPEMATPPPSVPTLVSLQLTWKDVDLLTLNVGFIRLVFDGTIL